MQNENGLKSIKSENMQSGKFESDTQKIIHKHLADPEHHISEDEIRNVRIGMTPGPDAVTKEALNERDGTIDGAGLIETNETDSGNQQITPWDTLNTES